MIHLFGMLDMECELCYCVLCIMLCNVDCVLFRGEIDL